MVKPLRCSFELLGLVLAVSVTQGARADVFKYVKGDGTIVYTDNLSDLPEDRRAMYNRKIAERERAQEELERAVGKEEVERREAEAKRQEIERQVKDEQERKQRIAAFDAQIRNYRAREQAREKGKLQWQTRMKAAKQKLEQQLAEFNQKQEEFASLATRADFTLLPGQVGQRDDLQKKLKVLEQSIDALIVEIDETIPEQARKAGIPPGWLRD